MTASTRSAASVARHGDTRVVELVAGTRARHRAAAADPSAAPAMPAAGPA